MTMTMTMTSSRNRRGGAGKGRGRPHDADHSTGAAENLVRRRHLPHRHPISPRRRTEPPGGRSCYWERLKGFSGAFEDIITNGIGNMNPSVTIASSDPGLSDGPCGTWPKTLVAQEVERDRHGLH